MLDSVARIFVGFDSKEIVAYHVLSQSIIEHSSIPVAFSPIVLGHLGGVLTRERHPLQSTDFSFSRFLTPYLSQVFRGVVSLHGLRHADSRDVASSGPAGRATRRDAREARSRARVTVNSLESRRPV